MIDESGEMIVLVATSIIFQLSVIIYFTTFASMRKSRLISNFIAIILLVALSQKIGFGIFYHNWQHTKDCTESPAATASLDITKCSCIDDFSMPFTETEEQIISSAPVFLQEFVSLPSISVTTATRFFNSLRAPPALLS